MFLSLRTRILLLIAIPFAVMFAMTVYHELGEQAFTADLVGELALLLLTFGAVWLGSESLLSRRIAALATAAENLQKGDLTARVGSKTVGDEIGRLAQSFDRMADSLQAKELQHARAVRALRVLSACNRAILHATQGEQALLDEMCMLIGKAGGYCAVWIGYADSGTEKRIRPVARWGSVTEQQLAKAQFTWGEADSHQNPPGKAIRTGMPVVAQNLQQEPGGAPWREYALRSGCGSCLALPLRIDDRVIGVLNIGAAETSAFGGEEVGLLQQAAGELSFAIDSLRIKLERDRIALEQAEQQEQLRKSLEHTLLAIANTVELRNPYTDGHQRRVAELAAAIARELGLPQGEIQGIQLAASIHDLGRVKVPAAILAKPGALSDSEIALIRTHAQAGYELLKDIQYPWPIAQVVLQHHERLDGSGYPQGLAGDQVLLVSRIIAVADVLEAMATHRPYRPAQGIDAALAELERGRGKAFDPDVVDACGRVFREQGFAFASA